MGCGSSKGTNVAEGSRPQVLATAPAIGTDTPARAFDQATAPASNVKAAAPSSAVPAAVNELREASEKPLTVFIIGGPGSGKGTQCSKILDKYGGGFSYIWNISFGANAASIHFRHLKTGALLRAEAKREIESEAGKRIASSIKSGSFVQDEQVIEALEREIKDSAWFGLAFLVSGFPRTLTQAKMFEDRVRPYDLVLYFDCPESVMVERLTSRGRLSGGADDSPGAIKKRISTFKSQTLPIVGYFEGIGVLQRIFADRNAKQIFLDVEAALDKRLGIDPIVTEAAQSESSEWRVPQVIDIEKRFYGSLQTEP